VATNRSFGTSIVIGAATCALAFIFARWQLGERSEHVEAWRTLASSNRALDMAGRPITVVVFLDYLCPYCAQLNRALEDSLPQGLRDSISVFVRHVPGRSSGRMSIAAAALVNCAIQRGRGRQVHDWLLTHQHRLPGLTPHQVAGIVSGNDSARTVGCMLDRAQATEITSDVDLARALDVRLTPSVAIDSEFYRGAISAHDLTKAIIAWAKV
jgi:protein-disulfide isomerase